MSRNLPPRYEWRSLSDDDKFRALYEAISGLDDLVRDIYSDFRSRFEDLEVRLRGLENEELDRRARQEDEE
jgi:hypothetical protein